VAPGPSSIFNLLDWLYLDEDVANLLSFEATFRSWVEVEIALAESQFEQGLIGADAMDAIRKLSAMPLPDSTEFLLAARNVGYPIIELVAEINRQLPAQFRGLLHLGATTQDILDSGLALQIGAVGALLTARVVRIGDGLAGLVHAHAETLMPGRTHAQQATPTTFGLKCAVYLGEFTRHTRRLKAALHESTSVSLFGAAGTSSALGDHAVEIRKSVAAKLGLRDVVTPWHVSRDSLLELASSCSMICTTLVRFAREIIDLSRTEIAEVSESEGWHRGASSTMPQKRNPITSEAIIGMGLTGIGAAIQMSRAAEAQHERAAGEWQLEWKALPEALAATVSTLALGEALIGGLSIDAARMLTNLQADHDLILSEAYMIELAKTMGREQAHDLVYRAAHDARVRGVRLHEALLLGNPDIAGLVGKWPLTVADCIGQAPAICSSQVSEWQIAKAIFVESPPLR